jgi:hypothetical protein
MRNIIALAAATILAGSVAAHASTLSFTKLDNPADPTFNQLLGIDNAGEIVGYFGIGGTPGHPNQGYKIIPPYTSFTNYNYPMSVQTQITGITQGGNITGFWSNSNTGTDANFGFIGLRTKQGYTLINVNDPLAGSMPPVTQVLGINNSKVAVGFYNDANSNAHGFSYTVSSGQFKPVTIGAATAVAVTGINNLDLICGFYTNEKGRTLGFIKSLTAVGAISFAVPNSANTQFLGVNDQAEAVGFYEDNKGIDHGVIYNKTNGTWMQVDAPGGVNGTVLNGLNDKNQIVGFYTDAAGNVHGLLVNVTP